jgi:hypothetical protein
MNRKVINIRLPSPGQNSVAVDMRCPLGELEHHHPVRVGVLPGVGRIRLAQGTDAPSGADADFVATDIMWAAGQSAPFTPAVLAVPQDLSSRGQFPD